MKAVIDTVWTVWSLGASVYDYFHTSALEERIHTLEKVQIVHQFLIGFLITCVILLIFYIICRNH